MERLSKILGRKNAAYREAERKIEEAQRSEATALDLNGMGLTELPETIGQLATLWRLDISYNQLTTLPESIGLLTALQSLNLSHNQLAALPEIIGQLTQLQSLNISCNPQLTALPESIGQLKKLHTLDAYSDQLTTLPDSIRLLATLQTLDVSHNQLTALPDSVGQFTQLQTLDISHNQLTVVPESIGQLREFLHMNFSNNQLKTLPEWITNLTQLQELNLSESTQMPSGLLKTRRQHTISFAYNDLHLTDLPPALAQLEHLRTLNLDGNPLNPELAAAYEQGFDAVMAYLRAKAEAQIVLNEAKLILVGEGEVGKTCLMDALADEPWQEHNTTHGIAIRPIQTINPWTAEAITLNGWDFGGQRVYRPTHQLFFSAPAVYLVVWKPREGIQQGSVREWIQLIKHREPDAKILVVATHGGPGGRQPDINRQELWDLFGRETVLDFFHVDSKPDENSHRRGIERLKQAIARVAAELPEMGRTVPRSFQEAWDNLAAIGKAYLSLTKVHNICRVRGMDAELIIFFVRISHQLGHFIHYEHDPALREIVVLKPDWLATAISFVLDDEETRDNNGLVTFPRLSQLWHNPTRVTAFRYPTNVHPIFVRLMERFDLSYRVVGSPLDDDGETSLIGQLVPDLRPEDDLEREWPPTSDPGDLEQMQICQIVNDRGQSAPAEGLFYQLIVRLHRYSLGRGDHCKSVHWQRGLLLDDDYNGRALLEYKGFDIHITVRAPYPERFLVMLTEEVKYLVESFWEGLRCNVMVPCIEPCGREIPGTGLFPVEKLIDSKRKHRPEYPCPVCSEWHNIDRLLRNAPAAPTDAVAILLTEFVEVKQTLDRMRQAQMAQGNTMIDRFKRLDDRTRRILSRVDNAYDGLLNALTDEAREGPRLYSLVPVERSKFNPREWMRARFRLILFCERSRLPLYIIDGGDVGVYEVEVNRDWFKKVAPVLKIITGTLRLALPVAASGLKMLDEATYDDIENKLDFGKDVIEASLDGGEQIGEWWGETDSTAPEQGRLIRAHGGALRQLQALLKEKDPSFGGLVRVLNKRKQYLWVHPKYEGEY